MWLHPYGWRELPWSMSWLRPGGKKALIPRNTCGNLGFLYGNIGNTRVRLKLAKVHFILRRENTYGNNKTIGRKRENQNKIKSL